MIETPDLKLHGILSGITRLVTLVTALGGTGQVRPVPPRACPRNHFPTLPSSRHKSIPTGEIKAAHRTMEENG